MANFVAEIVNVGDIENVANNRGGTYAKLDVLYKNRKTGKVESKNLVEFNNKGVFNTVRGAKKGDVFTVTLDKNAKGYWEWTKFTAGVQEVSESETTSSSSPASVPTPARSIGFAATAAKTYETADERAKRQKLIVAQSSLSNAIDTLATDKGAISVEKVFELSQKYYDWVMAKQTDFSDMQDDIPQ